MRTSVARGGCKNSLEWQIKMFAMLQIVGRIEKHPCGWANYA